MTERPAPDYKQKPEPHHFDDARAIAERIRKGIPPSRPVFVRVAV